MSLLIKNWSTADWEELLKWAKIGANNAMVGEFAKVKELPPHGRLVDADAVERNLLKMQQAQTGQYSHGVRKSRAVLRDAPTIIPASEEE